MRRAIAEKARKVKEYAELIGKYKTVAVASIEGVPAHLLHGIRRKHPEIKIKAGKNVVIRKALEERGLEELTKYISGPSALVLSDLDPFRVFRILKSEVEWAPLRPGKEAPMDVEVEPGPTGLPPGPALSELKAAGLPVKMGKGAIEISERKVVVRKGEVVSEALAAALAKIGVKPIKVMVRINAAYWDGIVFPGEVLDVDEEKVREEIGQAHARAVALAYHSGYPVKDTMPLLLSKAYSNALALAVNAGYVSEETAKYILTTAYSKALALASRLPEEAGGVKVEVKEEEGKGEEKKEEGMEEDGGEEEAVAGLAGLFG